jgi:hypothetical protein
MATVVRVSALTPHIRVLRAEAEQLDKAADEYQQLAVTVERTTLVIMFRALAAARRATADQLEAEEREREARVQPISKAPPPRSSER